VYIIEPAIIVFCLECLLPFQNSSVRPETTNNLYFSNSIKTTAEMSANNNKEVAAQAQTKDNQTATTGGADEQPASSAKPAKPNAALLAKPTMKLKKKNMDPAILRAEQALADGSPANLGSFRWNPHKEEVQRRVTRPRKPANMDPALEKAGLPQGFGKTKQRKRWGGELINPY